MQRKLLSTKIHKVLVNCTSIDLGHSLDSTESGGGKYIDMTKYSKLTDLEKLFIPEKRPVIVDFLYPG